MMTTAARKRSWLRHDRKRRGMPHRTACERARQRMGKVPKTGRCEQCGALADTVWHHEDYSLPKDAVELCFKCHRARHPRPLPQGGRA